jgi:hypothetical protein
VEFAEKKFGECPGILTDRKAVSFFVPNLVKLNGEMYITPAKIIRYGRVARLFIGVY